MSPSGRALGFVWLLAGLAFLPAFASPQVSRTAWVLLPWLTWAGWPVGSRSSVGPPGNDSGADWKARILPGVGLAAPLVAVAIELDRQSGWALGDLLWLAGVGTVLCLAWGAARAEAARSTAYRAGWFSLVILLPIFVGAVGFGPSPGGRWSALVNAASPLGWALGRLVSHGDSVVPRPGTVSVTVAGLVWMGAARLGRTRPA